jgi:hypothetical protein
LDTTPGDFIWYSWWMKWHRGMFFLKFIQFTPTNQHSAIIAYSSITNI